MLAQVHLRHATPSAPALPPEFRPPVETLPEVALESPLHRLVERAPAHGLRFDLPDGSFSFSGDTEWVDGLIGLADGVDLHINECFAFDTIPNFHTTWSVLKEKLPGLNAKRILLTHMGRDMLANTDAVDDPRVLISEDGMCLEF